jgi:hypothetical protein
MNLRNKNIRASSALAGTALASLALVIAVCGWAGVFDTSPESTSGNKANNSVEHAVTSFLDSYRNQDWSAASSQSCGDLHAQLLGNDHHELITTPTTQRSTILAANDFHYTTIEGSVGTTYTQVTIGVPGDPEGNATAVAFFALAKTGDNWRVCTATNAAAGALN